MLFLKIAQSFSLPLGFISSLSLIYWSASLINQNSQFRISCLSDPAVKCGHDSYIRAPLFRNAIKFLFNTLENTTCAKFISKCKPFSIKNLTPFLLQNSFQFHNIKGIVYIHTQPYLFQATYPVLALEWHICILMVSLETKSKWYLR